MRSDRSPLHRITTLSVLVLVLIAAATPAAAQQESVLYNFSGAGPQAGVVFDALGNLYGTDASQGVYELTPQAGGSWTENTVYNNFGSNVDTEGDLIFDSAGNLYGATFSGGLYGGGFLYQLIPESNGTSQHSPVHDFGNGTDGSGVFGNLRFDASAICLAR
jgi:hypothetical protein